MTTHRRIVNSRSLTVCVLAAWWCSNAAAQQPAAAQPAATQPAIATANEDAVWQNSIAVDGPSVVVLQIKQRANGWRLLSTGQANNLDEALQISAFRSARSETVQLGPGQQVIVLHIDGPNGEAVTALLQATRRSGVELLQMGRSDWHGDPGERQAIGVQIADVNGDGQRNVAIGTRSEQHPLCRKEPRFPLLRPQVLDSNSRRLRPYALQRLSGTERRGALALAATRRNPDLPEKAVFQLLEARAASSADGDSKIVDLAPPPTALTDSDRTTMWIEGVEGDGRGEFVTMAWRGGSSRPIVALAFALASADAKVAGGLNRPRTLWLAGDTEEVLHVSIPEDPRLHPGELWWVVPPTPLQWNCMSVLIDETYAAEPPPADASLRRTAIAEISAYAAVERQGGLDPQLMALMQRSSAGTEAMRLLSTARDELVPALAKRWKELNDLGRQRAVRLLASRARSSTAARWMLQQAASAGEAGVKQRALQGLLDAGDTAYAPILEIARQPTREGDKAARALARLHSGPALVDLLGILNAKGGGERAELRSALREAFQAAGVSATATLVQWHSTQRPSLTSTASIVAALAPLSKSDADLATALQAWWESVSDETETFSDRWRLLQAAASLPANRDIDARLLQTLQTSRPWMLQAAAIEALSKRQSPRLKEAALLALRSAYPRLRVAGIEALPPASPEWTLIGKLALNDAWPIVRQAAVAKLHGWTAAHSTVITALEDPSFSVRATAVRTLADNRDRSAWPKLRSLLLDERQDPQVRVEILAYVGRLCLRQASVDVNRLSKKPSAKQSPSDLDLTAEAGRIARTLQTCSPVVEHHRGRI